MKALVNRQTEGSDMPVPTIGAKVKELFGETFTITDVVSVEDTRVVGLVIENHTVAIAAVR